MSIDFDNNRNSSSLLDDGSLAIFDSAGKKFLSDPVFNNGNGRESQIQPQRAQDQAVADWRKSRRAVLSTSKKEKARN